MTILVGTASWADKSLIACGRFYPSSVKSAEDRLRYYASQFPVVEVDSSYYAMPSPATAQLWAERTPADFTMNVKAFRLFTGHQTDVTVLHKDIQQALPQQGTQPLYYRSMAAEIRDELWRRFHLALAPLQQAGRLGLVHFQFPPWLLRNREGHEHVRECVTRMTGHTVSVEFRNRIWFEGDHAVATLAFLRELGVVHTVVDAPQGFTNSVPAVWRTTHGRFALVRLHGRNAASWNRTAAPSSSGRFDYVYSIAELEAIARSIRALADRIDTVHVVFNTNNEDQGQRNARALLSVLEPAVRKSA